MSKTSTLAFVQSQINAMPAVRSAEDQKLAESQAKDLADLQALQAAERQAVTEKRTTEDAEWSAILTAVNALPDDPAVDPQTAAA